MRQTTTILPLYHFFERLRQNGFLLGMEEYQTFLKVLEHKLGLSLQAYQALVQVLNERSPDEMKLFPKNELLHVCRLLWLKPGQSQQLFEEIFEATYLLDAGSEKRRDRRTEQRSRDESEPFERDLPERSKSETSNEKKDAQDEERGETIDADIPADQPIPVRIAISEYKPRNDLAVGQDNEPEIEKSKFLFTQNYFPVDKRKIQQNLRMFPFFRQSDQSSEIDVEATIKRTIEKGYFSEVAFKKLRTNAAHLLLLLDHLGSMVAFEQLAVQLQKEMEQALGGGKNIEERTLFTYYFYNSFSGHLYLNKAHTWSERIDEVLGYLKGKSAAVIIFSDAGAARGRYNAKRIAANRQLLAKLHTRTNKIAWLNPMPQERWEDTSAEEIAKNVAMFEADENGIKKAVDFLKGTAKIIKLV